MGVIDDAPEPLAAPKYRRFSNDPALNKSDSLANRAEVNQINSQLDKDYKEKLAAQGKAQKAGVGGVKTEKRADVEANIKSALEDYQMDQPKGSELTLDQIQSRKIRSAAYGIYASNDLDSNQAIERAIGLIAIDKKNPRALSFEARDMKDGSITVRDGGVSFKVPKQTFNELAQLRLQRVRAQEALNQESKVKADKQSAIDKRRSLNDEERQKLRGVRRDPSNSLTPRTLSERAFKPNDDEVDSRLPDTSRLLNSVGRAISESAKSAAKTYDKDFAKRK
jgi:hypothetical protein